MKMLYTSVVLAFVFVSTADALAIKVTTNASHVADAIRQGDNATLNCSVTSEGGVDRLDWLKDGRPITDNITLQKDTRGMVLSSNLFLANVNPNKTNGKYLCRSWQNNSTHVETYILRVDEPPVIESPFDLTITIGEMDVNFETIKCSVRKGWPVPIVQWISDETNKVLVSQKTDSYLSLPVKSLNKTVSSYTCRAMNRAGENEAWTWLSFKKSPPPPMPPKIIFQSKSPAIGYPGNNMSFEVRTQYTPIVRTSFQWSFNRRNLLSNKTYTIPRPKFINHDKAVFTLTINNVSQQDEGVYRLIVQTNVPNQTQALIELLVSGIKGNDITAVHQSVQFTDADSSVILQCEGKANNRLPRLKWLFNGTQLNTTFQTKYDAQIFYQDKFNTSFRFTLKIYKPASQDIGQYTCGMDTPSGWVEAVVILDGVSSARHVKRTWIQWIVVSSILLLTVLILIVSFSLKRWRKKSFSPPIRGLDTSNDVPTFDLFISYTNSDFDWVRKHLIPLLEKHQVVYSIHSKDFEIGKTIVDNMADSVYTCRHVVAVVSEKYMESKFCRAELDMAINRTFLTKKPLLTVIKLDAMPIKKVHKQIKERVYCQTIQKDGKSGDKWGEEFMKHLLPLIKTEKGLLVI